MNAPPPGEAFISLVGENPQTPMNSPVPGLAARSCGTLFIEPAALWNGEKISVPPPGDPLPFPAPGPRSP